MDNHTRDRTENKQNNQILHLLFFDHSYYTCKMKMHFLCIWLTKETHLITSIQPKKIGKIESNMLIVVFLDRENFWSGQPYGVDVIVTDFTTSYSGGLKQRDAKQVLST